MKKKILLLICVAVFSVTMIAQKNQSTEKVTDCETTILRLQEVFSTAKEESSEKKLIIIASLGKDEKAQTLNQKRLQIIKNCLLAYGLPEEKLVLAEGEKRKGLAKIQFFISGELLEEIYLRKNGELCLSI